VTHRVLVIGYGSLLRTDDAVGPRVATVLAGDARLAGAEVHAVGQLTPDLAEPVAAASLVVLVDASGELAPGAVAVRRVEPAAAAGTPAQGAFSHHVDAVSLVSLAAALYGRVPPVHLVSVGAASLEFGEQLSPAIEAAIPAIAETVVRLATDGVPERA